MSARHVQSPITSASPLTGGSRWSLRFVVALIIGLVFVYAGGLKAADPVKFASDIQNFHLLSWPLGIRFAFYLPWLEILCGLALITGWLRKGGVAILTTLMLVFIVATVAARIRGIDLDCGCFGKAAKNLPFTWHLVIDFALLAGLLGLWFSFPRPVPRIR